MNQDTDIAVPRRKRCCSDSTVWNLKFSNRLELDERGGRIIVPGIRGICPAIETAEMFDSLSLGEGIRIEVACE